MPSPFTPIADYGFLSDCHTGALVAPDGGVDWLCVPRFDAPSVFGSLLDREAGTFRFGPFGINVPTPAVYEPGTNVLVDDVEDAVGLGRRPRRARRWGRPRARRGHARTPGRPPTTTPSTSSCARRSASTARSRWSWSASRCSTTARPPATWTLVDGDGHTADATGADVTIRLHTDMALGHRGRPGAGPPHAARRRPASSASLSWADGLAAPDDVDDAASRIDATVAFWRDWLDRARIPDHRWRDPIQRSALAIKGLTYMPTGATVAALTTSLPETPGGERNWDYRYTLDARLHVHAAGAALAEPRLGGRRVHAVRRRPRGQRGRRRCRSCTGSTAGAT